MEEMRISCQHGILEMSIPVTYTIPIAYTIPAAYTIHVAYTIPVAYNTQHIHYLCSIRNTRSTHNINTCVNLRHINNTFAESWTVKCTC